MLLARPWNEPEKPRAFVLFQQFDFGNRVGRPLHDLLAKPWFAPLDPVLDAPVHAVCRILYICNRAVLLLDQAFGE